jgi:hypothetical protein
LPNTCIVTREPADDAADADADVLPHAPDDAAAEEGGEEDAAAEDVADESADDGGHPCPVWTVPSGDDPLENGTEAHPFITLRRALDSRWDCDTVILRGGTTTDPFDPRFDLSPNAGETLTIEGDPAGPRAELDARDDIGLFATGEGTLTLRHLAIRGGHAAQGGCLNAQVGGLVLEDTEWSDCHADEECAAVWVYSPDIVISDSRFSNNDVPERTEPPAAAGAACLDGPLDATQILVERSTFEDNSADWGHALYVKALTRNAIVRDSVFLRNTSREGPSALGGQVGDLSHNRFERNETVGDAAVVQVGGTPESRIVHNLFLNNLSGRGPVALQPCHGLVANNLFVGNGCRYAPGSGWCSAAVWVTGGCSVDLRNNTFADNSSDDGIAHLSYDSAFGQVRANVFAGGSGRAAVGTDYPDWGVSAELAYNVWWRAPVPVFGDGVRVADGNFEADPLFVGADDYRLGAESAARDAGDPDPLLADPDGSRNDPGAFGGPEGDWTPLPEGGAP